MPSAKAKERLATEAAAQIQLITDDASAAAGMQIKTLIDLITSLLKAMEEQQQAHAKQIEEQKLTLTKIFTQEVDTLKAENDGNDSDTTVERSGLHWQVAIVRGDCSYTADKPTKQPSVILLDEPDAIYHDRHAILHY